MAGLYFALLLIAVRALPNGEIRVCGSGAVVVFSFKRKEVNKRDWRRMFK